VERTLRGCPIFRQGEPCPGIFVVERGRVRIYLLSPAGKEHVLHMVGPGETFPCPATAEAVEATALAFLPARSFLRAIREDHGLCLQLLAGLTQRVRQLVGLLEDLVLRDAAGRLARHILKAASTAEGASTVVLPSLKRHLASHLNLTSETLSRMLRKLAEARLIEPVGGRRLRIVDREGLLALAEGLFPVIDL
jgi:CRP/FNR family transcriptional regulator